MNEWYFMPHIPGMSNREAVHSEFFSADAVSLAGRALVREGIQNSLDAQVDEKKVLVRIQVVNEDNGVDSEKIKQFFSDIFQKHISADENGIIDIDKNLIRSKCSYILFEDYDTRGLIGDPEQSCKPERSDEKNHFYYFFRAEGQTDKREAARGSWGVGKHVFPRASRINTMFGLTIRSDDSKCYLMGKTILKSHYVEGRNYQDGFWGKHHEKHQHLMMPIDDPTIIREFSRLFNIQRGNIPGFSIVIPWPDPDISEREIIQSVYTDYFYPILAGQLEVIVQDYPLDSDSLIELASDLDSQTEQNITPLINLSKWALNSDSSCRITLDMNNTDKTWAWRKELIPKDVKQYLRDMLFTDQNLAIRIPVTVHKRDDTSQDSFFDIFLNSSSDNENLKPVFIRRGVIISEVKNAKKVRGVTSLVIIEDQPLADFLKTAENPSHTDWDYSRLKADYARGAKTCLEFVKTSVSELFKILIEEDREEDRLILADYFPMPETQEEKGRKRREPGKKKGKESQEEIPDTPQSPKSL